jgi:hypothetical protein
MNSEQQKTKTNEKRRKRYAEDPEYRERVLAAKRGRKTQRLPSDPEFREKKRARDRAKNWKHRKVANAHVVDYDAMLARQGGVCKICRKPALKRLCLDHDHANGWIRGLLCHKCNTGLGLFDDDIGRILRAAVYLVLCGALPALACAVAAAMARFFRAVMAGLSPQVGLTRLAARNAAELGQARVPMPSTSSKPCATAKTLMPGTRPGMTAVRVHRNAQPAARA